MERQERREIGEEEWVANFTTTETTGSPESSVQVVSSQTYRDVQKKKILLLVSGNSIDKEIKKTKPIKKKKPSKFKINESSINAYISHKTRHQNEAIKTIISKDMIEYIRKIKEQIHKIYNEKI